MLVKSLGDKLAWRVQRELVKRYFRGVAPEGYTLIKTEKYDAFDTRAHIREVASITTTEGVAGTPS